MPCNETLILWFRGQKHSFIVMWNSLFFFIGKSYVIIIDGAISEIGKLLISVLNLDAGKWRIMRSGFHLYDLHIAAQLWDGSRGELEVMSMSTSWGLLGKEMWSFTCVSLRSWWAGLPGAQEGDHQSYGALVGKGQCTKPSTAPASAVGPFSECDWEVQCLEQ